MCLVKDCQSATKVRSGLCAKHYMRKRRHGTTECTRELKLGDRLGIQKLLISKVIVDTETGCWNWICGLEKKGYAIMQFDKRQFRVSRLSAYAFNGFDTKSNKFICHSCDNKKCINPKHLFAGTHQDNMNDAKSKNRFSNGENHHQSKINAVDAKNIRKMYGLGFSSPILGKIYDLDHSTVLDIVRMNTWKHT